MTNPRLFHEVGSKAMDWLADHREYFRARRHADTPPEEIKDRFKPIGELAMIGGVLFREGVAGTRQTANAHQLLDFAWHELLDGGDLLAWMQHEEPLSPYPVEIYVPFRQLGYRSTAVEQAVHATAGLLSWAHLEMEPTRRLGLITTERRAGMPASIDLDTATRRTWLGSTPEPWTVEHHIAYSVTHTVFHLTNWGARPEDLPDDIAEYLTLWLPAWLDEWATARHWDLVGELLVVDACLPVPSLDEQVWHHYAQAQNHQGAMPVEGEVPDGDPHDVFDLVYHPTLIAAFASALATSRAMAELTRS